MSDTDGEWVAVTAYSRRGQFLDSGACEAMGGFFVDRDSRQHSHMEAMIHKT